MKKTKRIKMIIDFAKKVLEYPKGSKGYDPVDAMNLEQAIKNYEREEALRNGDFFGLKKGYYN